MNPGKQACPVTPLLLTCPMRGSQVSEDGLEQPLSSSLPCELQGALMRGLTRAVPAGGAEHKHGTNQTQQRPGPRQGLGLRPHKRSCRTYAVVGQEAGHVPASPSRKTSRRAEPNPGTCRPSTASAITDSFTKRLDVKPAVDGQGVTAVMKQDWPRKAGHLCMDHYQGERLGHPQQHLGRDPKEQVLPRFAETAIPGCQKSVMVKTKWTCPTKSS